MTSQSDDKEENRSLIANSSAADAVQQSGAGASASEAAIWKMLAETSQSLQMLSASIKAAVSSLLDNTIIWDRTAQHDFMVSINESIDRSFPLIVAMTLAMKSKGGTLEWIIEPCSIQEIISRVVDTLEREGVEATIALSLPVGGKPVLVDYDYLRIALKMLIEALLSATATGPISLQISAIEEPAHWQIHVAGEFTDRAAELIHWLGSTREEAASFPKGIQSEIMVRAFTAIQILNQQDIAFAARPETSSPVSFTLVIPSFSQ
jgi:K+-sensing histidine kinase KdpD